MQIFRIDSAAALPPSKCGFIATWGEFYFPSRILGRRVTFDSLHIHQLLENNFKATKVWKLVATIIPDALEFFSSNRIMYFFAGVSIQHDMSQR